jgi:hypothetical protein
MVQRQADFVTAGDRGRGVIEWIGELLAGDLLHRTSHHFEASG